MAAGKTIAQEGVDTTVEISTGGDLDAAFEELPGSESVDDPGGQAETQTSRNFKQQFQSTGGIPPAPITVALDPFVSLHPTIQKLRKAAADKTSVWLRYTTSSETLLPLDAAARTVAFSAAGVATFAGTDGKDAQEARWQDEDYSIGLAIRLANGTLYPIKSISDAGVPTVVDAEFNDLTAQVAAVGYSIVRPGTRQSMLCRIANIAKNTPSAGHVTGSVTFNPKTVPGPEVPVYA